MRRPATEIFADQTMCCKMGDLEKKLCRNKDIELLAKDGRKIPVLFSSSLLRDNAGITIGIVCTFRDITERKQAEEELKKAHNNLGKMVRERTEELRRANEALKKEIAERKQAEERLKYLSFHDKLTGLYNRVYFEEELARLDKTRHLPLSVIIGDVNGLKLVNDTFGHQEGDRLLMKVAKVLTNSCRGDDIVCRWGGDEFAILLPLADEKDALSVCSRIKENCDLAGCELFTPSISLGAASKTKPEMGIEQVIKDAEEKMYRNKFIESSTARGIIIQTLQKILADKSPQGEGAFPWPGPAQTAATGQLEEVALLAHLLKRL